MRKSRKSPWILLLCVAGIAAFSAARMLSAPRLGSSRSAATIAAQSSTAKPQAQRPDPWTSDQTVDPATLVKEISGPANQRPTVVSVSPHALYLGGHIPGAVYEGPGFSAAGIESLKQWAGRLPRSTNLVVYCGCCPLVHCPNLRPAFRALQSMGFTHLRALILPTYFYTDWYAKGYPTEKGG
jgi:hypothetical protein